MGEVENRLLQAGRAARVDAARHHLLGLAHNRGAAGRAIRGHAERAAFGRLGRHPHHLRDHVTAPLDHHAVADLQAEPGDLVLVVQGRARHRHPAHLDRPQPRPGGDGARPPHLHVDVLDHRFRLLGGRLAGDGPPRRLRRGAEPAPQGGVVELEHDAVDVVGQRVAPRHAAVSERREGVDARDPRVLGRHLEAEPLQDVERRPVRVEHRLAAREQGVGVEVEAAGGGDAGVEHAQRAGGGVAGVGEGLPSLLDLPPVEPGERLPGHHHLAAHLEVGRHSRIPQRVRVDRQRQRPQRPRVGRDDLPLHAVAPRQRQVEPAGHEADRHRRAVELQLPDVVEGLGLRQLARPPVEVAELGVVEGVLEAEHHRRVGGLLDPLARGPADPPARRVGSDQLGEPCLQLLELAHEGVELGVRDVGVVEDVVAVLVAHEVAAQLGDAPAGIVNHHLWWGVGGHRTSSDVRETAAPVQSESSVRPVGPASVRRGG